MVAGTGLRLTAALVVATVSVTACGHADQGRATTSGKHADQEHHVYSDVNPPPRRAGNFVVKVLLVTRIAPDAGGHSRQRSRAEGGYWAEEVRTCVKRSSSQDEVVGLEDWRAVGTDGRTYPAEASGHSLLVRTPRYPEHEVLAPGQCATGWWSITVPDDRAVRAIEFAPAGGPTVLEWPTMR